MDESFERFVRRFGLRHFEPKEFLPNVGIGDNPLPPAMLWGNLIPTAVVLDFLRDTLGKPIRISSTYRCPVYNKKIGGSELSQHQAFSACDFSVDGAKPQEVASLLMRWDGRLFASEAPFARTRAALPGGMLVPMGGSVTEDVVFRFHGGVGVYPTFVHLDTRGYSAQWKG